MVADSFPWWYPRTSHEAWKKSRRKGAWHFVLVNGVLLYGGLMFLLVGLLSPWLRQSAEMLTPQLLAINALVWAVAGSAWGALIWHFSERNFLKHSNTGTPKS